MPPVNLSQTPNNLQDFVIVPSLPTSNGANRNNIKSIEEKTKAYIQTYL